MEKEDLRRELAGYDIFNSLASSDQEKLIVLFRPHSFQKNEIIFLKGDPACGLFLIRQGRVKISVVDRQGSELIFTYLGKGDLLGDLALFDGKPRSATATAIADTNTLYLDRKAFLEYLITSPKTCIDIINMLCGRLRRLSTQFEEISFLDVSGRVAKNLLQIAGRNTGQATKDSQGLTCAITQEELAKIIGASREMVNKVLNSFVDLRLVALTRKRLSILNPDELNRIASYDGEY